MRKPKQSLFRKEVLLKADQGFIFDYSIPPLIQYINGKIKITFWTRELKGVVENG
jgi:hypothetical protein